MYQNNVLYHKLQKADIRLFWTIHNQTQTFALQTTILTTILIKISVKEKKSAKDKEYKYSWEIKQEHMNLMVCKGNAKMLKVKVKEGYEDDSA